MKSFVPYQIASLQSVRYTKIARLMIHVISQFRAYVSSYLGLEVPSKNKRDGICVEYLNHKRAPAS